ncbi:MAG TPA: acyl-CoA dehydrogenase [Syntrophomonas sp.]|nr:acyl-CoA dehydrogenase [Syntrophomonas sp.]
MASNYLYNNRDHKFIFNEWLDMKPILSSSRYADYYSMEDIDMILDQALNVAKDIVAPAKDEGSEIGARYENGKVTVPPSFHGPYKYLNENGWGCINEDPDYEGALPAALFASVIEFFYGANAPFVPYIKATAGAARLIARFGDERCNQLFRDRMFSGQWGGTMALTEPSAGSDVGDLLTKAYPTDEPGIYKIRGSKCFITNGEQDMVENIVHLVLARVEGARPGTAGLSLFAVPKIRTNENGDLLEPNDVNCTGIEHKMGKKASATCVMNFGEANDCLGYILGDAPGEDGKGKGIAQMFQMMNGARMETGHASLAETTVAYHNAVEYAKGRIQGRSVRDPKGERQAIIKHEDIRRMLMDLKAYTEAMRALVLKTYWYFDMVEINEESNPEAAKEYQGFLDVQTPIIKAYCSDKAWELVAEAVQIYGGYGFMDEYPLTQICRDVKIYSIWEGTNFIQSMDLVRRKWKMENGSIFAAWLEQMSKLVREHEDDPVFEEEFAVLKDAVAAYREIQESVNQQKISMTPFYATRILHATGNLACAYMLLDQALVARKKIHELGTDHFDYPFYNGKIVSAKYFAHNVLPQVMGTALIVKEGDASAIEADDSIFEV